MADCKIVKSQERNTAGEYQEILVCYCGTTSCLKIQQRSYPLPNDFLTTEEEKGLYKSISTFEGFENLNPKKIKG